MSERQTSPHVKGKELRRILEAGKFTTESEIEHAMLLTYEHFGRIAAVTSYSSHFAMNRDYVREAYDAIAYNVAMRRILRCGCFGWLRDNAHQQRPARDCARNTDGPMGA